MSTSLPLKMVKRTVLPIAALLFFILVLFMFIVQREEYAGVRFLPIKFFDAPSRLLNTTACQAAEQEKQYAETFSSEWLDRSNSFIFRQYYNRSSCPGNPYYDDLREMLREWKGMAERLKIRYFITDGTLLGAWRDGDLIPYDFDLDIRVHIDDLPKLYPLRQKKESWNPYLDPGYHIYFTPDWRLPYRFRRRFSCRGKQVRVYEGECSFTDPPARLINDDKHIDIFVYQVYEEVLQFLPSRYVEYSKSHVLPLVKCSFLNETTWCPREPKQILDNIYNFNLRPQKVCKDNKWIEKDP